MIANYPSVSARLFGEFKCEQNTSWLDLYVKLKNENTNIVSKGIPSF